MRRVFKQSEIVADLNVIEKILKKLEFLEERNFTPSSDFDPAFYRGKTYIDNWKAVLQNNIYDILLSDNSLLMFKRDKISYTYLECPFECMTYRDFINEHDLDELEEDRGFYDYYEDYITQCPIKDSFTSIRYDLDCGSYKEGLHPASHIHIGYNNQIRIGTSKVLNPLSFFFFILRQIYPAYWKEFIEVEDWKKKYKELKTNLDEVISKYWNKLDKQEMFFN